MVVDILKNVTYTTTGLTGSKKQQIIDMVNFIGGHYVSSLNTKVTLLIAGTPHTEKMNYCIEKRRDVTIIDWADVSPLYKRVRDSKEIINISILDHYPWPLFHNKSFCLVRLAESSNPFFEKYYITNLIKHFGGEVTSSLSEHTDFVITISTKGRRYETAVGWGTSVVHPKWVIDCCNCLSLLETSAYDIGNYEDPNTIGKLKLQTITRGIVDYNKPRDNVVFKRLKDLVVSKPLAKSKDQLFKGFVFFHSCFDAHETVKLLETLKTYGGEVTNEYDYKIVSFILVPSKKSRDELPRSLMILNEENGCKIVNEWFVERCIHYNKIMLDSWSIPRPKLHLKYKLKIHITGFVPIEHLHIKKLIQNLNLTFMEELTKECDYLIPNLSLLGLSISNSPQLFRYKYKDLLLSKKSTSSSPEFTKKKINSAKKWDIPVVSLAFIWQLSQSGLLPDVLNESWCIFGPHKAKPASNFLEYARSVSGGTFITQRSTEPVASTLTKTLVDTKNNEERQNTPDESLQHEHISVSKNDISQNNSPTKIHTFPTLMSPRKRKTFNISPTKNNIIQMNGNKLNLREWKRREKESQVREADPNDEEQWWREPDDDLVPVFKRRRR